MNIFEEELRRLFEDGMILDCPVFSGQLCMATLGTDCHVQIQFVPDAVKDQYDTLQIVAVRQTNGFVDAFRLKFSDTLKAAKNGSENTIVPYILLRDETAAWFPALPLNRRAPGLRKRSRYFPAACNSASRSRKDVPMRGAP